MSDVVGKKFYNAEQPSVSNKVFASGLQVAFQSTKVGNPNISSKVSFQNPTNPNITATITASWSHT